MDRAEQESWREKVRLCAVAIGLKPVAHCGYVGWIVREYAKAPQGAPQDLHYYPLASDTQAMRLIKSFGLSFDSEPARRRIGNTRYSVPYRRWRVRSGAWHDDLNKAVVDYIAGHPELKPRVAVRKSTPTR